ncbi:hypothetical protein B0H67DRAFT_368996 [Lasiosphaeris hirsuta]|uniref:Uncharacterized protein n=1 Tax=Lasiosphaeris hirsuta TaxID=260670 RepID=A0AA40DLC8_9PEZI|nr:hypothetical protein B0H67DRAFT_368996 [Lasiosphaeris hirsuta]
MPPVAEMQQAEQASGQYGRHAQQAAEVPMQNDKLVISEAPAPAPAPVNNKAPIPGLLFPFGEHKPLWCSGPAESSETSHEAGVGAAATPEPKQGVFSFNLDSTSSPQWPRLELDPSGKSSYLFLAFSSAICLLSRLPKVWPFALSLFRFAESRHTQADCAEERSSSSKNTRSILTCSRYFAICEHCLTGETNSAGLVGKT